MKGRRLKAFGSLFVLFSLLGISVFVPALVSCHKGEFSVSQVIAQPYVAPCESQSEGQGFDMGLSLYVAASVPSPDGMTMVATDPSSNLTWSFVPSSVEYDGAVYYGTSDISMPRNVLLPQGSWNLEVLYKDGRTLDLSFDVSYRDIEGALERTVERPAFDSTSNLTVL